MKVQVCVCMRERISACVCEYKCMCESTSCVCVDACVCTGKCHGLHIKQTCNLNIFHVSQCNLLSLHSTNTKKTPDTTLHRHGTSCSTDDSAHIHVETPYHNETRRSHQILTKNTFIQVHKPSHLHSSYMTHAKSIFIYSFLFPSVNHSEA